MTTTDTPLNACPYCGAGQLRSIFRYGCGADALLDRKAAMETRTELCREREARQKAEAEVERLRDAFSHLTNEIECTPKCLSHQANHCDCGRLERAYAISHSIAQNPTK